MTSTTRRVRAGAEVLGKGADDRRVEALQSKIGTLSLDAQAKLEKDTAKKEAKAAAKADAEEKKKMASQVRYVRHTFVAD